MSEPIEDVRIIRGDVSYLQKPERTEAQKAQAQILDNAASEAEQAMEHLLTALDWLSILEPGTRHQSGVVGVKQLQERVEELKRVRR